MAELLKNLGISASAFDEEELEDMSMFKLMHEADITQKVSRAEIMQKLLN